MGNPVQSVSECVRWCVLSQILCCRISEYGWLPELGLPLKNCSCLEELRTFNAVRPYLDCCFLRLPKWSVVVETSPHAHWRWHNHGVELHQLSGQVRETKKAIIIKKTNCMVVGTKLNADMSSVYGFQVKLSNKPFQAFRIIMISQPIMLNIISYIALFT